MARDAGQLLPNARSAIRGRPSTESCNARLWNRPPPDFISPRASARRRCMWATARHLRHLCGKRHLCTVTSSPRAVPSKRAGRHLSERGHLCGTTSPMCVSAIYDTSSSPDLGHRARMRGVLHPRYSASSMSPIGKTTSMHCATPGFIPGRVRNWPCRLGDARFAPGMTPRKTRASDIYAADVI